MEFTHKLIMLQNTIYMENTIWSARTLVICNVRWKGSTVTLNIVSEGLHRRFKANTCLKVCVDPQVASVKNILKKQWLFLELRVHHLQLQHDPGKVWGDPEGIIGRSLHTTNCILPLNLHNPIPEISGH